MGGALRLVIFLFLYHENKYNCIDILLRVFFRVSNTKSKSVNEKGERVV